MSATLVCALAALMSFRARPAAALSSTAGQPAGAVVEEGLPEGGARPRRHSKGGYIVQAEPGANLKTSKAGHAGGASCHPPHPVRAPCHKTLSYGAHATTSNTKRTHTLYHNHTQ